MIQFKRGSSKAKDAKGNIIEDADGNIVNNWDGVILADGQPGYDKTTSTLKIGNGSDSWSKLKSLSLNRKQVLDSEKNAKKRFEQDSEDFTVFTYGTEAPEKPLVGDVYLHQYSGGVEKDYVVDQGFSNGWTFRKWQSGLAECWGRFEIENLNISTPWGDSKINYLKGGIPNLPKYPFSFKDKDAWNNPVPPCETASLAGIANSDSGIFVTWLGASKCNTNSTPAKYYLLTANDSGTSKNYVINLDVKGHWK